MMDNVIFKEQKLKQNYMKGHRSGGYKVTLLQCNNRGYNGNPQYFPISSTVGFCSRLFSWGCCTYTQGEGTIPIYGESGGCKCLAKWWGNFFPCPSNQPAIWSIGMLVMFSSLCCCLIADTVPMAVPTQLQFPNSCSHPIVSLQATVAGETVICS